MNEELSEFLFAPHQRLMTLSFVFGKEKEIYARIKNDVTEIESQKKWSLEEREVCLDDCFTGVPMSGAAHPFSIVAFKPFDDGPIVQTANLQDGWGSLTFRLSALQKLRVLQIRFCTDGYQYPSRGFNLIEDGKELRSVAVYKDSSKWEFFSEGKVLAEERLSCLDNEIISERLKNDDLVNLARDLGVPLGSVPLRGPGILLKELI